MIFEVVLLLLAILLLYHWYTQTKGMPPGPRGIPLSGMILTLPEVKKWQKKYGRNIFSCKFGSFKVVYICDFKLLKEALSKMEVANRPELKGFHFLTDGVEAGVILSNGQRWQNARRFLLRNLRDLGMGKSTLDDAIIHEAKFLVEEFKNCNGKPQTIPDALNIAVLNIIWQMVASRRYDLHDEEIINFIKVLKAFQADAGGFLLQEMFPMVKKILPHFIRKKLFKLENLEKATVIGKEFFGKIIGERKAALDPDKAENVIDEYLLQIEQNANIAELFSEMDLMRTALDLFGAGFDTTSNTLRWVCLYAAKYPEIQLKVQRNIDEVLSRDEFPSNQHKNQLPLVEAFLHEVLRKSSLLPLGIFRAVNADLYLDGYYIPKGTIVMAATGICHEDPKYWNEPHEFCLERFLDKEGKFVSHKEGFAPFGIGKRSCLGEPLARMELSIFTTALLQNFTFLPPAGQQIDLSPQDAPLQHFPRPQDICINIRK